MAEINTEIIERKPQRSIVPWILGLVLLLLVIWALIRTMDRREAAPATSAPAAAAEKLRDSTPPHLRQYA